MYALQPPNLHVPLAILSLKQQAAAPEGTIYPATVFVSLLHTRYCKKHMENGPMIGKMGIR
jgi:hypothetical protein